MEAFLAMVDHGQEEPVFAGYFESGGSTAARRRLSGTPYRVTLRPGTDWDWSIWRTSVSAVAYCYQSEQAWPELLFPAKGGWILESPPSTNDSFLYPMAVIPDAQTRNLESRR